MARVVDDEMRAYYERRAPEYDDWWLGLGRFTELDRPGWHEEVEQLIAVLAALPPAFADGSFDRVLTGHFYGHLLPDERTAFLAEARRVAGDLVIVDSAER